MLLPVIVRSRGLKSPKYFRRDAAFAAPELMKVLEAEGYRYAIRLKANAVLERNIARLLRRPVGRASEEPKAFDHAFGAGLPPNQAPQPGPSGSGGAGA